MRDQKHPIDAAYQLDDILDWLNPAPFQLELTHLLDRRAMDSHKHIWTGSLSEWFKAGRGLLQITGISGYGKTMIAASLVERVSSHTSPKTIIGYAFCMKLKVGTILRSLIWQIAQSRSATTEHKALLLEGLRSRQVVGHRTTQSDKQETVYFREILTKLLQAYDSTTLIFDGIDQSTSPEDLVTCISQITNSMTAAKSFNIVVTSQMPQRSMQRLKDNLGLFTLDLISTDVRQSVEVYVRHALNALEPPLDATFKVKIELECLKKADEGWPYVMHTLATKYAKIGRASEAEGVILEVLSFREARQRQDSDPIISSKRIMAWVLGDQGRRQEAEDLQRSILESCKRTKGEQDDMTKTLINDLSLTLSYGDPSIEQQQEAILLLEQISDAWKTPEGNETEKSLSVANNLAVAYMKQPNRLEDAEAIMQRIIAGDRSLHGEDSEGGVVYKSNLGEIYSRQHKWEEAEKLQEEALNIRKRTLGMNNLATVQCMSSLGWTYGQRGHFQEAKELQLKVLESRIRLQGATHPDTIHVLGNLAETVSKLGEMDDARKYARMALGY